MTESIKITVRNALQNRVLCDEFVRRGVYLNVTVLKSSSSAAAAGALCDQEPVLANTLAPNPTSQPTSRPSSQPTATPTSFQIIPKLAPTKIVSGSFLGFLTIILLIAVLRFNSSMLAMITTKKEEEDGHLYDILVVLNDDEEAIVENIKHKDIVFFRSTVLLDGGGPFEDWTMNITNEVLERRFEVQFYDQFDLLGQSGVDEVHVRSKQAVMGDMVVKKEVYIHRSKLLVGMIICVKPLRKKVSKGCENEGLHSKSQASMHSVGSFNQGRLPRSSSMTSMSDCVSAPSDFRNSVRNHTKISSNADCVDAHTSMTVCRTDVDTAELCEFYEDEMWHGQKQEVSTGYELKYKLYHAESDDSSDALSIKLPLRAKTSASHADRNAPVAGDVSMIRRRGSSELRHNVD